MPDLGTFLPLSEGLDAGQIAVCVIMLVAALFWLFLVPMIILSVVIAAVCRAFFGLPMVTWQGVESSDEAVEIVLKAARGELPDEKGDSGILRKIR